MHKWMNKKVRKMDWVDVKLVKWCVFFIALLLAKLFPVLLSMKWQVYLVLALVLMIRPVYRVYLNGKKRKKR